MRALPSLPPASLPLASLLVVVGLFGSATRADDTSTTPDELRYDVLYDVRVIPTERSAHVRISLGKNAALVKRLTFHIDPTRHMEFKGPGEIKLNGEYVEWWPPPEGGRLQYLFRIDHLRDARRYDARCAENWALFRGDDLIPPVRARTDDGAKARARLRLRLPDRWKAAVPFPELDDGTYQVDRERRGFDRPTGWILVGRLGISRVKLHGMHVTVAAPHKNSLRRQDILAFLRWTLPALRDVTDLPERLLIVGAGDPMWRGGLSGPDSFYLHADRPLIDDDMTSPLLHEMIHTLMSARAGADGDWIIEGLAELYSLEVLSRSHTISKRGYERALSKLTEKGARVTNLRVPRADGKTSARAVTVLKKLDEEIRAHTEGQKNLDDVLRLTIKRRGEITTDDFKQIAEAVAGTDLTAFFGKHVPPVPATASQVSKPAPPSTR